jgi:hypothetical protein
MGKIKTIKAATLVETLAALIIIMIIFVIAITAFVQVSKSINPIKIKAVTILDVYIAQTRENHSYEDGELLIDGFLIKREVAEIDGKKAKMNFTLFANGKLIDTQQRIILIE